MQFGVSSANISGASKSILCLQTLMTFFSVSVFYQIWHMFSSGSRLFFDQMC